jgi:hypothetical protein
MTLPELDFNTWLRLYMVYMALCCLVPLVLLGVGAFLAYRHGSSFVSNFITPDVDKMQASFEKMQARRPERDPDALVRTIIRRQSLRCGFIGAITGLGGLPTLPITLPIDLVASYRIQAEMVNFIARAYKRNNFLPQEEALMASLVMFGSSRVTQSSTRAATRAATKAATNMLTEVGSKALAKVIPLAGALVGFAVNYLTTQATGRMAAGVYSGRVLPRGGFWRWLPFRRRRDSGSTPNVPPEEKA